MREIPFDLAVKELESEIPQLTISEEGVEIMKTDIFGDVIETEVAYHGRDSPFAVFCHGFPGNEKNRDIAYELFQKGMSTAVIKYRGIENSEGTFSFMGAIHDIKSVLLGLKGGYGLREGNTVLIGYSYGGLFSLNVCNDNPSIKNLVCLSPIVNLERFLNEGTMEGILQEGTSRARGSIDQWRYEQAEMKHFKDPGREMVILGEDDTFSIIWPDGEERGTYRGKTMIKRLDLDSLLVVHGTYDDKVSMSHGLELFRSARVPQKAFAYIPVADHGFTGDRRKLIKVVSDHLMRVFNQHRGING